MRYRCLLIDHDDTSVDSSPSIHHPAHLEQLKRLGREKDAVGVDEWMKINYSPGILEYLDKTLKLNDEEKKLCYRVWREYSLERIPDFFPGMLKLLKRFKDAGGIVVVVTHSEKEMVEAHYKAQKEIPGFFPDRIIGWTGDSSKNKPDPWPVFDVIREFGVRKEEILVVDDLKPGILMAQQAGVDTAGVGWSHRIPEIIEDMKKSCTYYVRSIEELKKLIFESTES